MRASTAHAAKVSKVWKRPRIIVAPVLAHARHGTNFDTAGFVLFFPLSRAVNVPTSPTRNIVENFKNRRVDYRSS
jgi:hypothetical protein